jgi:hypothetical protein
VVTRGPVPLAGHRGFRALFQTPQISAVRPGLANFGAYGLSSERQYVDVGWTS